MSRKIRSRREFMRLLAAGSAVAMAAPVAAVAAESAKAATAKRGAAEKPAVDRMRRARSGEPVTHAALPEKIEEQKKSTADSLARIRAYDLPPGSPPSFVFRPLAAKRAARSRG